MEKLGFDLMGFAGVVEDRDDPQQLGRVRVRCFGIHTEMLCNDTDGSTTGGDQGAKKCIDTEQLPWFTCLSPNTQGVMNGIGTTPSSLTEGTWVFGVFLDGKNAQQGIVLGSVPGIPECINPLGDPDVQPDECDELSLQSQGFYDPRKADDGELDNAPRPPKKITLRQGCKESESDPGYGSFAGPNGQGLNPAQQEQDLDPIHAQGKGDVGACIEENDRAENYPLEGEQDYAYRTGTFKLESDVNRLARTEDSESEEQEKQDKTLIKWKKDNVDKDVPTAEMPELTNQTPEKCAFNVGPNTKHYRSEEDDDTHRVGSPGSKWTEPETKYEAQYPYNHVKETESGHVEEWDDTPGAERYHRWHRAGSFLEIHPDGTVVEKIVGEKYTIVYVNDNLHVEANCNVTVDKAYKLLVNADGQAGNHFDIEVGPNSDLNINGGRHINVHAKDDLNINAAENLLLNVGKDLIARIGGDIDCYVSGNVDQTIAGNQDTAIAGNKTESIFGADGFVQEIQKGSYVQRILKTSYVISGQLMTEIGLGDITMNPLNRPGSVVFEISADPTCQPVPEVDPPTTGSAPTVSSNPPSI